MKTLNRTAVVILVLGGSGVASSAPPASEEPIGYSFVCPEKSTPELAQNRLLTCRLDRPAFTVTNTTSSVVCKTDAAGNCVDTHKPPACDAPPPCPAGLKCVAKVRQTRPKPGDSAFCIQEISITYPARRVYYAPVH